VTKLNQIALLYIPTLCGLYTSFVAFVVLQHSQSANHRTVYMANGKENVKRNRMKGSDKTKY